MFATVKFSTVASATVPFYKDEAPLHLQRAVANIHYREHLRGRTQTQQLSSWSGIRAHVLPLVRVPITWFQGGSDPMPERTCQLTFPYVLSKLCWQLCPRGTGITLPLLMERMFSRSSGYLS